MIDMFLLETTNRKSYGLSSNGKSMTLSDLQRLQSHLPIESVIKSGFPCSYAAVDKISTDIARRAVPLQ